jgi:DNA-binding CsgD family transcriptional regulator
LAKTRSADAVHPECGLTPREREVLDLASRGKQRGEIAMALGISENTVKHHFSNIYAKLGVHSAKDALLKLRGGRGFLD